MKSPNNRENEPTNPNFTWVQRLRKVAESSPYLGQSAIHAGLAVKALMKYKATEDTDDLWSAGIHGISALRCFGAGVWKFWTPKQAKAEPVPIPVEQKPKDGS